MRHKPLSLLGLVAVVVFISSTAALATGAAATTATALAGIGPAAGTVYTDPAISGLQGIATGPDGALWFVSQSNSTIGRVTPTGTVSTYRNFCGAHEIAAGPDGALWSVGGQTIGRITTDGTLTNCFDDPRISPGWDITAGPDGALWFTGNDTIGRITTSGVLTSYRGTNISDPRWITTGPDGALWFTNMGNDTIGRITTDGAVTGYGDPSIDGPLEIVAGPDGALWFTNLHNDTIGRITTDGTVTSYGDPGIIAMPYAITAGPDGALWFTNYGNNTIGRMTTSGILAGYSDPAIVSGLHHITAGPDGAVWFTSYSDNTIRRIETPRDHTPPAIVVPTDLSQDATSASGAVVTYTVSVSDDLDPNPTLTCTPASGRMFPIGGTTVICTATDASVNTATAGFVVHIRGADEQLANLGVAVSVIGPGTSLANKIAQAQVALDRGNVTAAQAILRAFANEVSAQKAKTLPADTATALVGGARRIVSVLG